MAAAVHVEPAIGERANAQLKHGHILRKLWCSPHRAGRLANAIHVLHNYEPPADQKAHRNGHCGSQVPLVSSQPCRACGVSGEVHALKVTLRRLI